MMLPSELTIQESLKDSDAVSGAFGCRLDTMPITGSRAAVSEAPAQLFGNAEPGLAEENIQSRPREPLLMAISNKFRPMLLTTGNKSEIAASYVTIYGDIAGGYNPIKDLCKTQVFETFRWLNANHRPRMMGPTGEVVPSRVIDKPPSAESREG